jgi:HD-like signal output (HDOD) protein
LLGLNAVKNIAVAASLGQLFRGVKLCDGFTARDLWTHCISVAVTARELARQMKLPIADEAFLAGLIHDIGILVMLHISPDKLGAICARVQTQGGDYLSVEQEIIGMDHQMLGMGLTEHWKFTRPCQLVAGHHHQPTTLADNNRLLLTLVYVADTLCCQHKRGFNLTAQHQQLDESIIADIDLTLPIIERAEEHLDEMIASAMSILG